MSRTDLYRRLFVHRDDVFAEQQPSGAYLPVRRRLEDIDIAEHLEGFVSYGVYVVDPHECANYNDPAGSPPIYPANTVRYVVFDLDTYDPSALDSLARAVERLVFADGAKREGELTIGHPFRCLLLEDSGGKGYHVWLLLSEPVPAARVRRWVEPIRTQYDAMRKTAPDWPALEIFPKQDTVPDGGYGNLVKLPFGVHQRSGTRARLKPWRGWAQTLEDVVPFDVANIPEAAAAPPGRERGEGRSEERGLSRAPFACIERIMSDGAPQGCRDDAMLHLAHYWRGTGLPDDMVQDVCERANERFDPPLPVGQVRVKVRSALRMEAPHPSCSKDWLRDYCPGSERVRSCPNYSGSDDRRSVRDDDDMPSVFLSPEARRALRMGDA